VDGRRYRSSPLAIAAKSLLNVVIGTGQGFARLRW